MKKKYLFLLHRTLKKNGFIDIFISLIIFIEYCIHIFIKIYIMKFIKSNKYL